jgi:hypothetical protein
MTRCFGCTHPNTDITACLWITTLLFFLPFIVLQIITFRDIHDVNINKGDVTYINYDEYKVTITDYKCLRDIPNDCYPGCDCKKCTNIVTDDVSCDCDYVKCTIVGNYNNDISTCEIVIPFNDDDGVDNVFNYYEANKYQI